MRPRAGRHSTNSQASLPRQIGDPVIRLWLLGLMSVFPESGRSEAASTADIKLRLQLLADIIS